MGTAGAAPNLFRRAVAVLGLVAVPALGYAATPILLASAAIWGVWQGLLARPTPDLPRWVRGSRLLAGEGAAPALLFALAFALIALSSLFSLQGPADLLPLFGFTGLLLYAPLAHLFRGLPDLARLPRLALYGAGTGLLVALVLHFGFGMNRAAEGFFLTDPYRLATTTLLLGFLGLGALFVPGDRRRYLSLCGPLAALGVIYLTGSRTALLALPVLGLLAVVVLLRRPRFVGAALLFSVAVLAIGMAVKLPGTARRSLAEVIGAIQRGEPVADVSIAMRLKLYRLGAEAFATAPFAGHGWGEANMVPILGRFTPDELAYGRLVHLHDDALQFALSGGVLGLAAWLLILVAPLLTLARLPRDSSFRLRLFGVLTLSLGALLLGLPDTLLGAPVSLTIYLLLLAAVLNWGRRAG